MPRRVTKKIGEVHQVTYEPTFFDKVKEVVGGFLVFIIVIGVIGSIFT